ncbi:MAG: sigma factor G inhibitor Gin [Eubacteriales bacterium]|nr:sigma factor G inhibitor Gin [Bacillota bacterium]
MAEATYTCILCLRALQAEEQGLLVLGHNICPECESKIVSLTRDDPDYEHFKSGLKKIWQRLGA